MLTHIFGAKCVGIDAVRVTVEIDITRGIGIHLVGMADIAVKESLLRTVTALQSLGYHIPGKKIVINLAPADLRKNGSGYDLPIAVGILAASEQRHLPLLGKFIIMGELGLDGSVRSVPGALPFAEFASKEGFDGIILPEDSALEALQFKDIAVYGVGNMEDALKILEGEEDTSYLLSDNKARRSASLPAPGSAAAEYMDFADIIGQEVAKRGLEIAAAGGHNALLLGSPGSGKSSLAKALSGILPPLSKDEALVTSKIYSIAGRQVPANGPVSLRPFRSPHYSASLAAIIGGGGNADSIVPGEVSLAHNGVLFLDEMGQMPRSLIESLRAPIEDRRVTISRLKSKITLPSSFMLVAASNPCPCGWWGEGDRCICTPTQRLNYLSRLSGPIMDRIDIQLFCRSIPPSEMASRSGRGESSAAIASRVLVARRIQAERFASEGINVNAEMSNRQIERFCPLSEECRATLEKIMEKTGMSIRAYFRIIRVARTIADLAGVADILPGHIMEAASMRFLDKSSLI